MIENVGPYRITGELGRGGMGVVYRAVDSRLDRVVAIKALPVELAGDAGRLERFEREARTLASLNHPNVAGILGVEQHEGSKYLVLEFVDGETLAERLDRGALDLDEAIELGAQIAAGVDAAHDAGVIHRDLKPANIKITPEGVAKVLDFGLAKSDEGVSTTGSGLSQMPTQTSPARSPTVEGAILGTAAYMSPEQARGRKLDRRSDVWSFGVVLYEMLCGASPFIGETATDSIGAILHKDLDLGRLPRGTPAGVRRVLSRCVERDKSKRYRDIGDVRVELLAAMNESIDVPGAGHAPSGGLLGVLAVCVVVIGVLGVLVGRGMSPAVVPDIWHVTIESPVRAEIKFSGDNAGPPAVSPDGSMVVFSAAEDGKPRRLWLRRLGERDSTELVGTGDAMFPFWSPDSKSVGFFTGSLLRRVDLASRTTITVCEAGVSRGGAWTSDGRIIFTPQFNTPLVIVDANGGNPEPLTLFEKNPADPEENLHTTHRWPEMLPDGEHFLFLAANAMTATRKTQGLYLGNLDGSPPRRIMACDYGAVYRDGWLLFVREGVLLGSRMDLARAELTGELRVVAQGVAGDLSTWHGQFSVGGDVLVYNRLGSSRAGTERTQADQAVYGFEGDQVSLFLRDGRVTTRYAEGVPIISMSLASDGASLALAVPGTDGSQDLWIYPTGFYPGYTHREIQTEDQYAVLEKAILDPDPVRFTFTEGSEYYPVWSPDSQEIAFGWIGEEVEREGLYRKRLGEAGQELLVESDGDELWPTHWTRDGKYLIFSRGLINNSVEGNTIWALPLEGGEPIKLVDSGSLDDDANVSPDGRWLAFDSNRTGIWEAYVVPFAPGWPDRPDQTDRGGAARGTWQVSQSGGWFPRWSVDGTELFYTTLSGMLMRVGIDPQSDTFRTTGESELFQTPVEIGSSFSVGIESPTERFYFSDLAQSPNASISVVVNWQQILAGSASR